MDRRPGAHRRHDGGGAAQARRGALVPAAVRHRGRLAKGEVPVSDAIVDEALRQGRALAVGDVRDDRRFAGRESVIMYGVDRVLCIPIGTRAALRGRALRQRPRPRATPAWS